MRQLWLLVLASAACTSGPRAPQSPAPAPDPVLVDVPAGKLASGVPSVGTSKAGAAGSSDSSSVAVGSEERSAVRVSPDKSLELAVYLAAGLPRVGAAWSPHDYSLAQQALGRLSSSNRLFLPRSGSTRSGDVFARVVSSANLASLSDLRLPAQARWELAEQYAGVIPPMLALYAFASNDDVALPREQIELVAQLLKVHSLALTLSTKDEISGAVDTAALHRTALAVLRGAGSMLGESQRYALGDRLLLARAMVHERALLEPLLRDQDLRNLQQLFAELPAALSEPSLRRILTQPAPSRDAPNASNDGF